MPALVLQLLSLSTPADLVSGLQQGSHLLAAQLCPARQEELQVCSFEQEAGLSMEAVDWVVCNSGADIWLNLRDESQEKPGWHADEAWEEHINFRCAPACRPAAYAGAVWQAHSMPGDGLLRRLAPLVAD